MNETQFYIYVDFRITVGYLISNELINMRWGRSINPEADLILKKQGVPDLDWLKQKIGSHDGLPKEVSA